MDWLPRKLGHSSYVRLVVMIVGFLLYRSSTSLKKMLLCSGLRLRYDSSSMTRTSRRMRLLRRDRVGTVGEGGVHLVEEVGSDESSAVAVLDSLEEKAGCQSGFRRRSCR